MSAHQISVVIPAYNAGDWLDPTCKLLVKSLTRARDINDYEVIIINDGSTDNTEQVAERIKQGSSDNFVVLSHPNQGRYITRKRGVEAAKYNRILFIDTRVWIDEGSLEFLVSQLKTHPERQVWNGHINVAKKGNVIARFGDAITQIGWRKYFRKPRLTSYGVKEFDHYPKGTGLFSAPKATITDAFVWFESNTADIRNSSDDTLLIRHIAEKQRIWLSPSFSATYFARTSLKGFISHTFYRGQFFVDGFLRKGTRFFYPLLAFLAATVSVVLMGIIEPSYLLWVIVGGALLWVLELAVAIGMRLPIKDALSLFALSPLFAVTYGAGIWKAVFRRMMK